MYGNTGVLDQKILTEAFPPSCIFSLLSLLTFFYSFLALLYYCMLNLHLELNILDLSFPFLRNHSKVSTDSVWSVLAGVASGSLVQYLVGSSHRRKIQACSDRGQTEPQSSLHCLPHIHWYRGIHNHFLASLEKILRRFATLALLTRKKYR